MSLLATDESYLKDKSLGLEDRDRAAIRGVMPLSGVYRIPDGDDYGKMMDSLLRSFSRPAEGKEPATPAVAFPTLRGTGLALNPFRIVFGDDRDTRIKASPLSHVRSGLPPFLILYAQRDVPMLPEMAKEFGKALADAKNDVEVRRIDNRDHNTLMFRARNADDVVLQALVKFIEAHR